MVAQARTTHSGQAQTSPMQVAAEALVLQGPLGVQAVLVVVAQAQVLRALPERSIRVAEAVAAVHLVVLDRPVALAAQALSSFDIGSRNGSLCTN